MVTNRKSRKVNFNSFNIETTKSTFDSQLEVTWAFSQISVKAVTFYRVRDHYDGSNRLDSCDFNEIPNYKYWQDTVSDINL